MLLEHLGVSASEFVKLQNDEVTEAKTIDVNLAQFAKLMKSNALGNSFHIVKLLQWFQELGCTLENIDNSFWKNLRQVAFNTVMASIRHEARILVPKSYVLVGVVDEGYRLASAGGKDIYELPDLSIFGTSIGFQLNTIAH